MNKYWERQKTAPPPPLTFILPSSIDGVSMSEEVPCPVPKLPVGTVYEGDLPPQELPSASTTSTAVTNQASKKKREERKLAIMMMSKKRKRLFDQIIKSRNKKRREVSELKRKREEYDEESRTRRIKKSRVS